MGTVDTAVHFALGMTAAFLTVCALLPFRTFRERFMPFSPPFVFFCGCWALIPDLPVVISFVPFLDWAVKLKQPLHHPIIGNIFFMHPYVDKVLDRTDTHQGFEVLGIVAMIFMSSVIAGYWTALSLRKRRAGYEN